MRLTSWLPVGRGVFQTRRYIPLRVLTSVLAAGLVLQVSGTRAQPRAMPDPGEIRGLKLGLDAQSMTLDGFGELDCGSNGGAPRQGLDHWSQFGKCRPEQNGLYEVYARFDDENEYFG